MPDHLTDGQALAMRRRLSTAFERSDFTTPIEIVDRMARDILAARRDGDDRGAAFVLVSAGWSWSQISRFGPDANDLAMTPAFAAQDVVDRLKAREVEEEIAEAVGLAVAVGHLEGDAA